MNDETPATAEGRTLHLVPDPAAEAEPATDPQLRPDTEEAAMVAPGPEDEPVDRDPLLARAERIADLPLAERPAAFDGLNRAVVAELNTLEEG